MPDEIPFRRRAVMRFFTFLQSDTRFFLAINRHSLYTFTGWGIYAFHNDYSQYLPRTIKRTNLSIACNVLQGVLPDPGQAEVWSVASRGTAQDENEIPRLHYTMGASR